MHLFIKPISYKDGVVKSNSFLRLTASYYDYCHSNPVKYVDPSGEQPEPKKGIGKWLLKLGKGVFYGGRLKGVTITAKRKASIPPKPKEAPVSDFIGHIGYVYSTGSYLTQTINDLAKGSEALGKTLGKISVIIDLIQVTSELIETGTIKKSTIVNTLIDIFLLASAFIFTGWALTAVAILGAAWGLIKIFKGDYINDKIDGK